MATLAELIKGFRHNVRAGYQTTLIFTGEQIHLTCEHRQGYIGLSNRPSITKEAEDPNKIPDMIQDTLLAIKANFLTNKDPDVRILEALNAGLNRIESYMS